MTEHSASTIGVKSKAKEEAAKKLDKLLERKMLKEKELKKIVEEAEAAATALLAAEAAYIDELAATHLATCAPVVDTAINISSFLNWDGNVDSLKVNFGDSFKCDDLNGDDRAVVRGRMVPILSSLAKEFHNQLGPLKKLMEEAGKELAQEKESVAKKRKGATGAAVEPAPAATSSASSGAPAAPALVPLASPASPTVAEKEAAAADKKAVDAAAAAETAKEEAEKAKQVALEKEQEALSHKAALESERAKFKQAASDKEAQAAALKEKTNDSDMDAL